MKTQDRQDRMELLGKVDAALARLQGRMESLRNRLDADSDSLSTVALLGVLMRLAEADGRVSSALDISRRSTPTLSLFSTS